MEILVCVKRVPDTSENEIEVNGNGTDIEREDLVYSFNEWEMNGTIMPWKRPFRFATRSAAV
jgi:electron transfer flavoprotein alpha/beta subunit